MLELYEKEPGEDSVVLCMDEKGPISAKKYGGYKWCKEREKVETNQKTKGRINLFAAYNPHKGEVPVISFSERKKKEDVCSFLKKIKKKFKRKEKVYIILDNFSSHKAKDAKKTAEELGLELVYLPTNSPHLNPIERRLFANMQKEAINGSNFEDVQEVIRVVTDYVEYYNNERKTTTMMMRMMKETVEKIKIPSS